MRWKVWLLLFLVTGSVGAQKQPGTIIVRNYTPNKMYIVLDGRNQGDLWANSYQSYETVVGDHSVEAYMGDQYGHQYVQLTKSYPCGEVTFTERDF